MTMNESLQVMDKSTPTGNLTKKYQKDAKVVSVRKTARLAGFLYLAMLPLGILGLIIPTNLMVSGDAAATAGNVMASASLLRLSIVSALLVQVVNIGVVLVLYRLLKPVNKSMASLMVVFLLVAVPIGMFNELNHFAALLFASGAGYLAVFPTDQQQALVSLSLDLHQHGIMITHIFWGLWLFPMGYLVFKSGFLPKIIGILLMIGCFGYLIDSTVFFFLPDVKLTVSQFTFIGEIVLPLWLVIKGVNVAQWEQRALEPA